MRFPTTGSDKPGWLSCQIVIFVSFQLIAWFVVGNATLVGSWQSGERGSAAPAPGSDDMSLRGTKYLYFGTKNSNIKFLSLNIIKHKNTFNLSQR